MPEINVDGLKFVFNNGWRVSKYDEWEFYRCRFSKMWPSIKAVDLLVVSPQNRGYLLEVKDYRHLNGTKPPKAIELSDVVSKKVFDTLAALLPAKVNHNIPDDERGMARAFLRIDDLKVVLHIEQPLKHTKLRPRAINPADVKQKLRNILKPIDAHPIVVEMNNMGNLEWEVCNS